MSNIVGGQSSQKKKIVLASIFIFLFLVFLFAQKLIIELDTTFLHRCGI